jgi:hypothetical protein
LQLAARFFANRARLFARYFVAGSTKFFTRRLFFDISREFSSGATLPALRCVAASNAGQFTLTR